MSEESFGQRLRRLREAKGWRLIDLAAQTRTCVESIQRYETDTRWPNLKIATRIAEQLDVSIDFLVYGRAA